MVRSSIKNCATTETSLRVRRWSVWASTRFLNPDSFPVSGRVQNETARGNKMRLCITLLSSPVGRATNPRFSRQNTGSCAVCWGGRASGGNGLPSPRSRCRRSPPRNGLAPPSPTGASTMSIRTPLNELAPRLQQQNPSLILFPQRVSF
jgi:hypothetical protein